MENFPTIFKQLADFYVAISHTRDRNDMAEESTS